MTCAGHAHTCAGLSTTVYNTEQMQYDFLYICSSLRKMVLGEYQGETENLFELTNRII